MAIQYPQPPRYQQAYQRNRESRSPGLPDPARYNRPGNQAHHTDHFEDGFNVWHAHRATGTSTRQTAAQSGTAASGGPRRPAFRQCAVSDCKAMVSLDLHYGYCLCHEHIDQDLIRKCKNCEQHKLMSTEHIFKVFDDSGLCSDCIHPCCVERCSDTSRRPLTAKPSVSTICRKLTSAGCVKKQDFRVAGSLGSATGATDPST